MEGSGSTSRRAVPIAGRQVEETEREVAAFDEERIRRHGRRFMDEQPDLARFLTTLTRDVPGHSAELTFYVGCVLWTMFDRTYGSELPIVPQALLIANFERLRGEMQRFVGADNRFLERYLRHADFMGQPHVVRYMVDTLLEAKRDWMGLSREARGICLVVLLAAVQAMDEALEGSARQP